MSSLRKPKHVPPSHPLDPSICRLATSVVQLSLGSKTSKDWLNRLTLPSGRISHQRPQDWISLPYKSLVTERLMSKPMHAPTSQPSTSRLQEMRALTNQASTSRLQEVISSKAGLILRTRVPILHLLTIVLLLSRVAKPMRAPTKQASTSRLEGSMTMRVLNRSRRHRQFQCCHRDSRRRLRLLRSRSVDSASSQATQPNASRKSQSAQPS